MCKYYRINGFRNGVMQAFCIIWDQCGLVGILILPVSSEVASYPVCKGLAVLVPPINYIDKHDLKKKHIVSRPGRSQGLLYKQLCYWFIDSFINSVTDPFPPTALRRRHAKTVRDRSYSYKIYYIIVIKNILNPQKHQNPISGSKVTAILLKAWILPIGGVALGRVCACSLRIRLVWNLLWNKQCLLLGCYMKLPFLNIFVQLYSLKDVSLGKVQTHNMKQILSNI